MKQLQHTTSIKKSSGINSYADDSDGVLYGM